MRKLIVEKTVQRRVKHGVERAALITAALSRAGISPFQG